MLFCHYVVHAKIDVVPDIVETFQYTHTTVSLVACVCLCAGLRMCRAARLRCGLLTWDSRLHYRRVFQYRYWKTEIDLHGVWNNYLDAAYIRMPMFYLIKNKWFSFIRFRSGKRRLVRWPVAIPMIISLLAKKGQLTIVKTFLRSLFSRQTIGLHCADRQLAKRPVVCAQQVAWLNSRRSAPVRHAARRFGPI